MAGAAVLLPMETEPIDAQAVEALAQARGATLVDLAAAPVEIEVRLLRGLLGVVKIIGLRESASRESRERIRSAIRASALSFPERSLLVNLAPAELRKLGPGLDLPIAAAILVVTGQLPQAALERRVLWGELGLDGRIRAVRGSVPVGLLARREGVRELVAPQEAADELAHVPGLALLPVATLEEAAAVLRGERSPARPRPPPSPEPLASPALWDAIVGQDEAKRAVLAAAAGGHHLLLCGPPGSGKSMLARSVASLLPGLEADTALEVSCIHSAAGLPARVQDHRPPFRAPHCSLAPGGMAGGGVIPRPGEVTLAHRGVLFLDELPHFRREVQDLLRTPLEDGEIVLSRAGRSLRFPARFQMVAAMNPCPCGHSGERHAPCHCSPAEILRYRGRVALPLLERIDLAVRVPFVRAEQRVESSPELGVSSVRQRIEGVRTLQRQRNGGKLNAELDPRELKRLVRLAPEAADWFNVQINRFRLSLRVHHRVLRVALTLADLQECARISRHHLARAMAYRETFQEA